MTGQSNRARYIDAFLPSPTPSFVDTEIENRQNYSMSIILFYFLRFHGIALHSGRNGRLCLSVFFLPLVLGMRLLLLCRATRHVLISVIYWFFQVIGKLSLQIHHRFCFIGGWLLVIHDIICTPVRATVCTCKYHRVFGSGVFIASPGRGGTVLLVFVWLHGLRQLFKDVIQIAYVFNGKCKAMYNLVILKTEKINKRGSQVNSQEVKRNQEWKNDRERIEESKVTKWKKKKKKKEEEKKRKEKKAPAMVSNQTNAKQISSQTPEKSLFS